MFWAKLFYYYLVYSPKLVVVPIGFAFEAVVIEMVVDCHGVHHSTVKAAPLSDQPILGQTVTMQTNHSMNLNACLNDVAVDHLMPDLNAAFDEHLHDESQMVHRIYSVKENVFFFEK